MDAKGRTAQFKRGPWLRTEMWGRSRLLRRIQNAWTTVFLTAFSIIFLMFACWFSRFYFLERLLRESRGYIWFWENFLLPKNDLSKRAHRFHLQADHQKYGRQINKQDGDNLPWNQSTIMTFKKLRHRAGCQAGDWCAKSDLYCSWMAIFTASVQSRHPCLVFQMLKITARTLIYMVIHPCKSSDFLGACQDWMWMIFLALAISFLFCVLACIRR